ncbi:MAG: hypothetical protein AAFN10_07335 [Bacteroidota bacterium]
MKYLLSLLLILFCLEGQSQQIKFGFKGNLGLTFSGNQFSSLDQSSYMSIPQLSFGVEFPVYFRLNKVLWLRSGIGLQNKNFRVGLSSVAQSALPVKGLIRVGIDAYAIQLPLIFCVQPKGNENLMLELGMLFARYDPTSQVASSGVTPFVDDQEIQGVELNAPPTDFEISYLPELYAAFSYFLPTQNRLRQQLQLSFEYALRPGSSINFTGEVFTDNADFPFSANFQSQFSTLKFSYTIFPFW